MKFEFEFENGIVKTFLLKNVSIDGIDRRDYPDFVDAYISDVIFDDGTVGTDLEVEEMNYDSDLVYTLVVNKIF